jgi:hypothetical protein
MLSCPIRLFPQPVEPLGENSLLEGYGLQPNATYFSVSVGIEISDEPRLHPLNLNGASRGECEFIFYGENDICFGSSYRDWQPNFFASA